MSAPLVRREFLRSGSLAAAGVALAASSQVSAAAANDQVVVGLMGCKRGLQVIEEFCKQSGVVVKYVCDVDQERLQKGADFVKEQGHKRPEAITDFRKILDDPDVDALICAAPNHWHGPATIMACAAGKHVYVEKPCSHNPREGELMIEAARKHKRCVQVGTQRRSGPGILKAVKLVQDGIVGKIHSASSSYGKGRDSIGTGQLVDVPAGLDYDMWQGPAPRIPYKDNYLHYSWHWFWHWGNGELGNNGVHNLDVCRLGMGVDYPIRVTSGGNRFCYEDDQQTADTHVVTYEFPDNKLITWTGHSRNRFKGPFAVFRGTDGSVEIKGDGSFVVYAERNEIRMEEEAPFGMTEHVANFLTSIRQDDPSLLNAEIEEGHKSTLLCHLGNIAFRTGRTLNCNPENGHIIGDPKAMKHWQREYEPGWEPKV